MFFLSFLFFFGGVQDEGPCFYPPMRDVVFSAHGQWFFNPWSMVAELAGETAVNGLRTIDPALVRYSSPLLVALLAVVPPMVGDKPLIMLRNLDCTRGGGGDPRRVGFLQKETAEGTT